MNTYNVAVQLDTHGRAEQYNNIEAQDYQEAEAIAIELAKKEICILYTEKISGKDGYSRRYTDTNVERRQ